MENVLLHQNPHWSGKQYEQLHRRELLDHIWKRNATRHIQVLTGIRRCGKSSVYRLIINRLMETVSPKAILFLNMDDPAYFEAWRNPSLLYGVVEAAEKITGEKVQYLFLDEVQTVTAWEKFVKSVYDSNLFRKIFVTGSNSSLLQNDYSALLSGRYFTDRVYPFSFRELLAINGISNSYELLGRKPDVLRLFDDVMQWGAFPEIRQIADTEIRLDLLKSYFDSIVMKDCIVYQKISDVPTFRRLLLYAMSNIGTLFSYKSLANAVGSNENTTKKYLSILADSYVVGDVLNFSFSQKEAARSLHKIYSADNGLVNALSYKFTDSKGKLLENFVLTELCKQGWDEITFGNRNGECDFVVKKDADYQAIQVCYELTPENESREWKGFAVLDEHIRLQRKLIITYNQARQVGDVEVIPAWRYFGEKII
ncbi:MAG: ATP-binding protein [Prevotellaceae bacterium]|jgi:predicted AAA+ superfamily ATPase|nr:ATP-binding protein [Prevotellaceae bacterium]